MFPVTISQLGAACKQYGSGRLPGADRRTLGAAYAMASAALVACISFLVVSVVGVLLGASESLPSMYLLFGTGALPLVVGCAFLAGYATWRYLPETAAYGAFGGAIATILTSLLSTVVLFPVVLVVSYGDYYYSLPGTVGVTLLFGLFGTLLTVWVTIPIGAVSGYLYERVRSAELRVSTETDKTT